MTTARTRSGAVMIVVLGLITIILGLLLGLTVKVYNNLKSASATQQSAQAWIMMQAARMVVWRNAGAVPADVTIGNLAVGDIPSKELDDRLGWARIKTTGEVIACGGSSGANGAKDASFAGADPVRDATDVRYYYTITGSPPVVTLNPAQADHYANRW
jgi:hypothetical protein